MNPTVDTSELHKRSHLKNKIDQACEECESCNGEEGIEDLSVTFNRWICWNGYLYDSHQRQQHLDLVRTRRDGGHQ
jgi:hypothetical protein